MPWQRHLAVLFVFVAAFVRPAPASASTPASPESRVGGFEVAAQLLVSELGAASREQHQGIGAAYGENASGYRFAAGGAARAPGGPSFAVTPEGEVIPVPKGATGPVPVVNPKGEPLASATLVGLEVPGSIVVSRRFESWIRPR